MSKFKYSKEERAEKNKEIMQTLEKGVSGIFNSESYKEYLKVIRKFHNYSFRNSILILAQFPTATKIAGFNTWKELGRNVKKGEKGIKILAPCPIKIKEQNESGETVEKMLPYFKAVSVFDISQTDGEKLPNIEIKRLSNSYDYYDEVFDILRDISPYPVNFIEPVEGAPWLGYCDYGNSLIAIKNDLSQDETIKVAIHEIAHAVTKDFKFSRNEAEIVAESVAFIVADALEIDSSDYSFGYIAGWAGEERKKFYEMLETIQKVSDAILGKIEKAMKKTKESVFA